VESRATEAPAPPGWPPGLLALFVAQRLDMVRLAHVITGSNPAAEDVVQEAFVRLCRHWDRLDNAGGYLRVTVVNLAREQLRRQGVRRRHAEAARAETGPTGDPEIDETWAAVCRLPARQRAVLALRFYEDLALADIAEILGCRPGTVKSNLHRGLARLREELS
jgi:RNA polymerase sigma-70 factor (sigma-E family)